MIDSTVQRPSPARVSAQGRDNVSASAQHAIGPAARTRVRPRLPLAVVRIACIVGALALWQLGSAIGLIPSSAIASPWDISIALGSLTGTVAFWDAIMVTLGTWAVGLGIATAIALPLGIAFGVSSIAYRMFRNTVDFLRAIPPVALVPLVLLLFGATPTMAVALIVFGSVWPLLIQTMYGVHQVDPAARDVARSYRLNARWVFGAIFLPSAAPFIATGFRIAATMSLLLTIGAQVIGGAPGIGEELDLARQTAQVAVVYAYIVASGVIGVIINMGLLRIERSVLSWHPSFR